MSLFAAFCRPVCPLACALALSLSAGTAGAAGADQAPKPKPVTPAAAKAPSAPNTVNAKTPLPVNDPGIVVERIRSALAQRSEQDKPRVLVGDEPLATLPHTDQAATPPKPTPRVRPRAPATAASEPRWAYSGTHGPAHWSRLKPTYGACASGQRQSPIQIDTRQTLQGPAEPLQLAYGSGGGSVVHTGHTIQVDVAGPNTLTVRGSTFHLQHLRFHHPAEVRIDDKTHAMAAHLLHRNEQGQMAVLVVLLDVGQAHPEIHKIWTHMPLEVHDSVPMPPGLLNPQALLPADLRYFQFMGSLSAPPCTEGVLWLVMKQPVTLSPEQLRLFAQLFPMNARPLQALNGRAVREAM